MPDARWRTIIDVWVRFEGPGKLSARRWHMVKDSPLHRQVTFCGRYVWRDTVHPAHGEGPECASCRRAAELTAVRS